MLGPLEIIQGLKGQAIRLVVTGTLGHSLRMLNLVFIAVQADSTKPLVNQCDALEGVALHQSVLPTSH
jgi:hypothetical protein